MYNPYVEPFEAEEYLRYRLGTCEWDNASIRDREAALQMASDDIDRLALKGFKKHKDQLRRFPRDFQITDDVPLPVKQATIELALTYLKGVDASEEYTLLTKHEMVYSAIREKRNPDRMEPHIVAGIPSLRAFVYLVPYLRHESEITLVRSS